MISKTTENSSDNFDMTKNLCNMLGAEKFYKIFRLSLV